MRNGKYKIVYCTPALYSAGGTERVVSIKANYFSDVLGYDVTVIVTEGKNGNSFFPLSDNVKVINLGINFEELWNISFMRKILLYLQKQRKYRSLLTMELMKIRPDITITTLRREINFINSINDGSKKIGEQHLDEGEEIDIYAYDLKELMDMCYAGTLQDAKTVAAIMAYAAKISK